MKFSGFNTSEKVGIGTDSPATTLDVNGTISSFTTSTQMEVWGATSGTQIHFRAATQGANRTQLQLKSVNQIGTVELYDASNNAKTVLSGNGISYFTGGSVGIGTTAPAQKLHIYNGRIAVSDGYNIGDPESNNGMFISGDSVQWQAGGTTLMKLQSTGYVDMDGASQVRLTLGSQGTAGSNTCNWIRGTGTNLGFNAAGGGFHWEVSGNEKMSLTSAGKLKLNTYGSGTHTGTSAYKLSVDSSGNIIETSIGSGAVDGAGTANYISKWTDGDTIGNSNITDDGTTIKFGVASNDASYIPVAVPNTFNTGWNNTSDSHATWINFYGYQGSTSKFRDFKIGNGKATAIATFDGSSGNFGIGTASPGTSTKLQVAGRGLFTGGTHDPADGSPKGLSLTFENNVGVIRALQTAVASYDIAIQPTSGGNVGIGTTAPEARLHVSQSSNPAVRLTRTSTDGQVLWFYRGSTASGNVIVKSTGMGLGGGTSENNHIYQD